ncbi:MAG: hypothetical protein R3178_08670, partial [Rhodothermales bacterium]|nr:hypothetical protein [Rhodothermales bacterium]
MFERSQRIRFGQRAFSSITPSAVRARGRRTNVGIVQQSAVAIACAIVLLACGSCSEDPETIDEPDVTVEGECPDEMIHIDDLNSTGYCIDRWEAYLSGQSPFAVATSGTAASASDSIPQGYISATVADAACRAAGKRLCTSGEWLRAC